MVPKYGGEPLPRAPLCLAKDYRAANLHLALLTKAIEQVGWSPSQRAYIRIQIRKWTYRAEGRDEHFEQWGTFAPRFPGSPPPSVQDLIVATWRRAYRERTGHSPVMRPKRKVTNPTDPRFRPASQKAELAEEQGQDEADD